MSTPPRSGEEATRGRLDWSEALHRALIASLPGRAAIIDREGRIVAVNRRWEQVAAERAGGAKAPSPIGDDYLRPDAHGGLAGGEPAAEVAPCIRAVLAGETEGITIEYEWSGSGGRRWYELLVERLDRIEGGAIITHLDITNRRVAELETVQLRDQATHIARLGTLSELASSLAHDLMQPLAAILTNAQAASRLLEQNDLTTEDLRQILTDIIADDRRAASNVARLSALARRDEGTVSEVDVNALVRDVVRIAASDASVRRVGVMLTLDAASPLVRGDRVRLEQLVLNLLVNAIEAAGARTVAQARIVAVVTSVRGPNATITVRDSGPGIHPDVKRRLFEPFVTTKPHGVGMGLAIARRIAEEHGGRITVESTDVGTSARCTLPLAPAEEV